MEFILTNVAEATRLFANPNLLLLMVLGVFIGLFIGALPGLGGMATLALLLPTAYGMDALSALALILGAYSAVSMGGAITAILLNTPGTGEQVVTTFDGYQLTRQGKGARALGAAGTASAVGGLIGVVALTVSIPFIRAILMNIAPPELFALSLIGVLAIGVLDASSVSKGLLSGLFGLMLSFVGYDPFTGLGRFTFGSVYLYDGLSIGAMTLGLFAIAEMIYLFTRAQTIAQSGEFSLSNRPGFSVWDGVKDTFRHWRSVLEGGLIGAVIGMIPGLGATVAMFLSYAQTKQRSQNPETFGKGNIEGVIAPEAADNAKEGGSLVPTVAFGIPGSSSMAIFMGIFLIIGLQPGPAMVTEHLDMVYYMAWLIAVSSVVATLIGLAMAPQFAKAAYIRPEILAPTLIAVSFIGSFVDTRLFIGVATAVVAGFVGYLFKVLRYSNAGITLGFLLGPIVERYMFVSMQAYGATFLYRPITLAILLFGVYLVVRPYLRRRKVRVGGYSG